MKAEAMGVGLQMQRPHPVHGEEAAAIASYRAEVSAALLRVLWEPHFRQKAQRCKECLCDAGGMCKAREILLGLAGHSYPKLLGKIGHVPAETANKVPDAHCTVDTDPPATSAP